jgi:hypothetical protein
MPKENVRAYIYRVTLAALPLLTAYGVVSESKVPLIIGLVAAVLNVGLATANTSTK